MRSRLTLFAISLLAALPRLATAAPFLTFEDQAAVATGVTPKGQVVWFSVAKPARSGSLGAHGGRRR